MKFRNKFIAKRIGTKTLASLLAFGMALGSPMAAFADDGETVVVAENTVQAKKTDGSEAFVSVSDCVRGMMESGAVRLNNETGYLEDTSTGQKVDPETGERLTETPDVPETPAIPDTPGNQENPESPGTPENPENPKVPEKPDTPGTPETPEKPDTPENPGAPEKPETPAVSLKYTDDRSYSVVSEKICSDCSCSCGKYAPDPPHRFLSENADPDSGRSDWSDRIRSQ